MHKGIGIGWSKQMNSYVHLLNIKTVSNSGNWFHLQDTEDCCNVQLVAIVLVASSGSNA